MARSASGLVVFALWLAAAGCGETSARPDAGDPPASDAGADVTPEATLDAAEPPVAEDPCLDAPGAAAGSPWPMRGGCPRRPGSRQRLRGPQSGDVVFTYTTTGRATAPVLTEGGLVVFGTDDGHVVAISPSGQKAWDVSVGRPVVVSPFVRSTEEIVVAGKDGKLLRLATTDGSERGSSPGAAEPSELLPLADGVAYTAADGKLHRTDTNLVETAALDVKSTHAPTLAKDGAILVASADGALRRIDGANVSELYRAASALVTAPAIGFYGDVFVVGRDDKLRSLGAKGELRFEKALGAAAVGSIATSPDGAVYVATSAGKVLGFDRAGKETVSFAPLGIAAAPVVGAQGTVFFGAEDTKLYAVLPSGRLLFAGSLRVRALSSAALSESGALFLAVEGGVVGVGP